LARARVAVLAWLQNQCERRIRAGVAGCFLLEIVSELVSLPLEPIAQGIADLVETRACLASSVAPRTVVIAAVPVHRPFKLLVPLRVLEEEEGGMDSAGCHIPRVVILISLAVEVEKAERIPHQGDVLELFARVEAESLLSSQAACAQRGAGYICCPTHWVPVERSVEAAADASAEVPNGCRRGIADPVLDLE
jgi:hypothetical protein